MSTTITVVKDAYPIVARVIQQIKQENVLPKPSGLKACPRCGRRGSLQIKKIGAKGHNYQMAYFAHRSRKYGTKWCYLGKLEEVCNKCFLGRLVLEGLQNKHIQIVVSPRQLATSIRKRFNQEVSPYAISNVLQKMCREGKIREYRRGRNILYHI